MTMQTPPVTTTVPTDLAAPVQTLTTPVQTEAPTLTPAPTVPDDKQIVIPTSALKDIKSAAKQRGMTAGQQATTAQFDAQAKSLGYADHADLLARAPRVTTAQPVQTPTPTVTATPAAPTPAAPVPPTTEASSVQARYEREQTALRASLAQAEARSAALQQEIDYSRASGESKAALKAAGFTDVGYGEHLLAEALAATPEDKLDAFDFGAFTAKVKAEKPYLFGTVTPVPVTTTATPGSNPPQTQTPAGVSTTVTTPKRATEMTTSEYHASLRARGLPIPGHGDSVN